MNKIVLILFLFFLVFTSILNSQVTQQWVARYNGPGGVTDKAYSLAVDAAGNVYVTGGSVGSGTGDDYCTIKYNSAGIQQWIARYNGPDNSSDVAFAIAIDGSGNVYVTGKSYGGTTDIDFCTIKYNSSGVQQWVARYNGTGNGSDIPYCIAVDGLGNVYVSGGSLGSQVSTDIVTIKYNSSGTALWTASYNGPINGTDFPYSLAVDALGNVYVTGKSKGSGTEDDYCTIKYNSTGVQQWLARYNGPGNSNDIAYSLAIDGVGNVYITGSSVGSGTKDDYATIKYSSAGIEQWVARYNGPGSNIYDNAYSIAVDNSGYVYVTGGSTGNGGYYEYCTIKYSPAGVQQWVSRYSGPGMGNDVAQCIALDSFGNVYVSGSSIGSGTEYDYATIKYNSSGVEQWVARYTGLSTPYTDYVHSLAVDGSGNVYVTGESYGSGTSEDYATIKYSQGIGIKNLSTEIPTSFSLEQNYPNPFNATTNIKFSLPKAENVKLIVVDLLGREMATLVNERLQAGTYSVDFDAGNLTSGVYFYRITTGEFSDIKKMILVK